MKTTNTTNTQQQQQPQPKTNPQTQTQTQIQSKSPQTRPSLGVIPAKGQSSSNMKEKALLELKLKKAIQNLQQYDHSSLSGPLISELQ